MGSFLLELDVLVAVSKLIPSDSSSSQVGAVVVKGPDGQEETLPADVVVMGVGVAPATEYLRNSAVFDTLIDKTGAISVDEFQHRLGGESKTEVTHDGEPSVATTATTAVTEK